MPEHAWWSPPKGHRAELIDLPDTSWDDVLKGMRDIQRINQLLMTYPILLEAFARHAKWPTDRPLRVLDVATGLADIPRALVEFARKRQLAIEVVGLDLNGRILAMAQETLVGYPEIRLVEGDALALPFEAGHFDWAFCHLALHHLPATGHERFFRELDRVIRPGGGILVGDVERSYLNLALARPFLTLFTSKIAQFDGIVSIENALDAQELSGLLARSGVDYLRREWSAPPAQFLLAGAKPNPNN
jgi:ubiquinone/menaquinone biosynthesis C-methylase UbiE